MSEATRFDKLSLSGIECPTCFSELASSDTLGTTCGGASGMRLAAEVDENVHINVGPGIGRSSPGLLCRVGSPSGLAEGGQGQQVNQAAATPVSQPVSQQAEIRSSGRSLESSRQQRCAACAPLVLEPSRQRLQPRRRQRRRAHRNAQGNAQRQERIEQRHLRLEHCRHRLECPRCSLCKRHRSSLEHHHRCRACEHH